MKHMNDPRPNSNMIPTEPAMTVLLGLPFHDLTLDETLDYCTKAMAGSQSRYLVTANVDFTAQAYEDADLKKIVFFADRVVCDGMPLVWLSHWFGAPLRERVAGSDMVPKLLEICANDGHPVYFFGSDLATLQEAKVIAEARYAGLRVVGLDSPPMGAVIEWDNDALCAKMRASGAHLLLVCLGCPKQERWICAHHHESGIPLSIGVGASLDFITGKQKRAPRWMQKTGMEWFWRMSGSPTRLVSRYSKDFLFLGKAAWQQVSAQRRRNGIAKNVRERPETSRQQDPAVTRVEWHGTLQQHDLTSAPIPETITSAVFLDASRVSCMDSSGLGRLATLVRNCRSAKQWLVAVRPSEAFRRSVREVRMDGLFQIVESETAALQWLEEHQTNSGVCKVTQNGVLRVSFKRSLDALYHDDMMSILESAIADSDEIRVLIVDLKDVDFIDSRAVGGLIRTWKIMVAKGGTMFYSDAKPVVREIIALLRLDKMLTEWKGEPAG